MSKYTMHSARASLAAVGVWFRSQRMWDEVQASVKIAQKVIRHTPTDKLLDMLIGMLAGCTGVVEVNTRVRPDKPLQRAFGREDCAEQSTISETLSACTPKNVDQLRAAIKKILDVHGDCRKHDFAAALLVVDVDVTGLPAGRTGEGVSKGYFAGKPNCRGRQLGRVLATQYDEIVVDRLYDGKRQLTSSLPELVETTEATLDLDAARRARTVLRVDGGGGTDEHIDWMLARGYQLLVKMYSSTRAARLAASVRRWYTDPRTTGRQLGWVTKPHVYSAPTRQLAIRTRTAKGDWSYHVIVTTADDATLYDLANRAAPKKPSDRAPLLAAGHAYDLRGGGLETQNRGDKQGLGITHRNKRRFAAQEILILLAQLAHNIAIWCRDAIAHVTPAFERFGIQRIVRDLLQVPGAISLDDRGRIDAIALNRHHPYAQSIASGLQPRITATRLLLYLGKT